MARLFCSLKEAADRLKKTEEELKEIVKQGKLRGFPDGPNLLLKVNEVEALVSEEVIEAVPKALEAETPAPPALQTSALEAPVVGTPETKVKGVEVPEAEAPTSEAPEAQTSELDTLELQTPGLDTTDLEMPELEAPEPEVVEPGSLDLDERTVAHQADQSEAPPAETYLVAALGPEEAAAVQPRIVSKRHFKTKPRIEGTSSLQRLSMWQWLLKGLREDNVVAVVVFGLFLCFIYSAFVVFGYVLYVIF